MTEYQLKAENIGKQYQQRQVVRDISLQLNTGEIVGLLGPNGAGKTTTFYMVIGLIAPDSGSIWLNERNMTEMPIHLRARAGIGYLPQESCVFRELSVWDNIMAVLQFQPQLSPNEQQQITHDLLDEFGLGALHLSMGYSLSGGERRRVEIARALATNPKFILLDEPFAGVDPLSIEDIKKIIRQLQQKKIGILITDHNVRETLDICDRAYIVNDGQVLAHGTADEIQSNELVKKVYLGESFQL
ncbi:MAG: LPS export ABC transporter ATP-binding protein [Shewanellaceae bacterium]|nr:LPS export ABC transporter ATP-binding protein [Shewanellaceae bacterium]